MKGFLLYALDAYTAWYCATDGGQSCMPEAKCLRPHQRVIRLKGHLWQWAWPKCKPILTASSSGLIQITRCAYSYSCWAIMGQCFGWAFSKKQSFILHLVWNDVHSTGNVSSHPLCCCTSLSATLSQPLKSTGHPYNGAGPQLQKQTGGILSCKMTTTTHKLIRLINASGQSVHR